MDFPEIRSLSLSLSPCELGCRRNRINNSPINGQWMTTPRLAHSHPFSAKALKFAFGMVCRTGNVNRSLCYHCFHIKQLCVSYANHFTLNEHRNKYKKKSSLSPFSVMHIRFGCSQTYGFLCSSSCKQAHTHTHTLACIHDMFHSQLMSER